MASLVISVLADVSKAAKSLQQIEQQTGSFADKAKGALSTFAGAFSLNKLQSWASEWTGLAKDASKTTANVGRIFGEASGQVTDWAKQNANALGLTTAAAEKYAITLGNQLQSYGVTSQQAATMSTDAMRRSADVAKVLGKDMDTVQSALSSALRGRFGAMKDLGVQMDTAEVQARLLSKGLGDLTEDQLSAAQASEVLAMFMEQTGQMAGAVQPGTMKELTATIEELKTSLGSALLPVLNEIIPVLIRFADWAKEHPGLMQAVVFSFMAVAAAVSVMAAAMGILTLVSSPWLAIIGAIVLALAAVGAAIYLVVHNIDSIVGAIETAIGWLSIFTDMWDGLVSVFNWVIDKLQWIASLIGGLGSGLFGWIGGIVGGRGVGAGGAAPTGYAAGVTVAPSITFTGDVGDPALVAARVISALEGWTAANGRGRLARLVGA
jgi:hypothetical protein